MASQHAALRRQNRPNHPLLNKVIYAGPGAGVFAPWATKH